MRSLLVTLLALGACSLAVLPQPGSFLVALLVMVAVFLTGGAKLALDLVELEPSALLADAGVLVAVGFALTQIPQGNTLLTEILFLVAIATQALPRLFRSHH